MSSSEEEVMAIATMVRCLRPALSSLISDMGPLSSVAKGGLRFQIGRYQEPQRRDPRLDRAARPTIVS